MPAAPCFCRYADAIADYGRALEKAPLAKDAWVSYLNRGSTLLAMDRPDLALADLNRAVELSKGDRSLKTMPRGMRRWFEGVFNLSLPRRK